MNFFKKSDQLVYLGNCSQLFVDTNLRRKDLVEVSENLVLDKYLRVSNLKVMIKLFILCTFFYFCFLNSVYGNENIPDCYQVKLGNQDILCLGQIGTIKASDRGRIVETRIETLANSHTFTPENITVQEGGNFYHVVASEMPIISLGPSDIDNVTSAVGRVYAELVVERIQNAINSYRHEHTWQYLLKGVIYTILASIAFFMGWKNSRKAFELLNAKVEPISTKILSQAKIKSYYLVNPEKGWLIFSSLISGAQTVTGLLFIYFYITIILSFFPWTAGFSPKVLNYFLEPLGMVLKMILNYIPNIFFIIIICAITHYFIKLVKLIFNEIESGNLTFNSFHKEWAQPTFKLLKALIYALALVMIFPYLPGSSSPAFQGLSVFLGVVISFSSGSAIANIIAGVVITYMRPFKLGDRVQIDSTVGDVIEKNFLVTRIKTLRNTDITIPNTMVLGSHIHNFSSSAQTEGILVHANVEVGYHVDWREVHDFLKEAAKRTEDVDQSKDPIIVQTALQNSAVAYEINVNTKNVSQMGIVSSNLFGYIIEVAKERGIELRNSSYHVVVNEK